MRRRVSGWLERPLVASARRVLDRYGAAGGGLLAGGLAYAALFAIVPAVLLLTGLLGIAISDPARRSGLTDLIVTVLPPLKDLVDAVLSEAARDAGSVSIVGAVILAWGASRFAVAFDEALARVMGGERPRGFIARNVGAVVAVVLLIGGIVVGATLSGVADFLDAAGAVGAVPLVETPVSLAFGLLPVVLSMAGMIVVYRIVPTPRPPWRATVMPGLVVGLALVLLTRVFVFLAPRLIGAAALLGTLATVFAVLAWLSLTFQAVLLGAAWVRELSLRSVPSGARDLASGSTNQP